MAVSERAKQSVDVVVARDGEIMLLEAKATTPAMRRAYELLRQAQVHLDQADEHISAAEHAAA
jgi:hypothetical protein